MFLHCVQTDIEYTIHTTQCEDYGTFSTFLVITDIFYSFFIHFLILLSWFIHQYLHAFSNDIKMCIKVGI